MFRFLSGKDSKNQPKQKSQKPLRQLCRVRRKSKKKSQRKKPNCPDGEKLLLHSKKLSESFLLELNSLKLLSKLMKGLLLWNNFLKKVSKYFVRVLLLHLLVSDKIYLILIFFGLFTFQFVSQFVQKKD